MAQTFLCFLIFLWLVLYSSANVSFFFSKYCFINNWILSFHLNYRSQPSDWTSHGGDLKNDRFAYGETKISPETVANLKLEWKFIAGKDISATPAIYNNTIYFPSWNGKIYALDALDGSVIWQQDLGQLTGLKSISTWVVVGVNWTVSRSTPTVADDILIVGVYGPANVVGLKRSNGELIWSTQLDTHNYSLITMSGTYYKRDVYVYFVY